MVRAERTTRKLKFWNKQMNEKNILVFKLCDEAKNNFQTPCFFPIIPLRKSEFFLHKISSYHLKGIM